MSTVHFKPYAASNDTSNHATLHAIRVLFIKTCAASLYHQINQAINEQSVSANILSIIAVILLKHFKHCIKKLSIKNKYTRQCNSCKQTINRRHHAIDCVTLHSNTNKQTLG